MNLLAFVAAWGLPMIGVLFVAFCVGLGYLTKDQRAHERMMKRLQHEARMEQMWNGYAAAALCSPSRQAMTRREVTQAMGMPTSAIRQFSGMDLSKEWEEEQERLREQEREQWEREREVPWLIPGIDGPEKKETTIGAYDVTEEFKKIGIRRS